MTTRSKVLVVGAGLFGSIISTHARSRGFDVTVIGEPRRYEASPAAGCVLSPNWLSSLSAAQIEQAYAVLGEHYVLHDMKFRTSLLSFKAKRIDPASILVAPDVQARVVNVRDGAVDYVQDGVAQTASGTVVVAAGVWSRELVPGMPPIRGLYGASLRFPGQMDATLNVYAPYRQSVGFNIQPGTVWFGDGSALIQKTWEKERIARIAKTTERASQMFGAPLVSAEVAEGARPYVEGHKGGYLNWVAEQLVVSTGGAKNGTVLAALHAHLIVERLQGDAA
jgi:glycine/D-amino acid oxidase-like deaminating enzyme